MSNQIDTLFDSYRKDFYKNEHSKLSLVAKTDNTKTFKIKAVHVHNYSGCSAKVISGIKDNLI